MTYQWPHPTPENWPMPGESVLVLRGPLAGYTATVLTRDDNDHLRLAVRVAPGRVVVMGALPEPELLQK